MKIEPPGNQMIPGYYEHNRKVRRNQQDLFDKNKTGQLTKLLIKLAMNISIQRNSRQLSFKGIYVIFCLNFFIYMNLHCINIICVSVLNFSRKQNSFKNFDHEKSMLYRYTLLIKVIFEPYIKLFQLAAKRFLHSTILCI